MKEPKLWLYLYDIHFSQYDKKRSAQSFPSSGRTF